MLERCWCGGGGEWVFRSAIKSGKITKPGTKKKQIQCTYTDWNLQIELRVHEIWFIYLKHIQVQTLELNWRHLSLPASRIKVLFSHVYKSLHTFVDFRDNVWGYEWGSVCACVFVILSLICVRTDKKVLMKCIETVQTDFGSLQSCVFYSF